MMHWNVELEQRATEKGGTQSALVVTTADEAQLSTARRFLEILEHRLVRADEQQMETLIDLAMPALHSVPDEVILSQARRNAEARQALVEEFGLLSAEQIHRLARSRAANQFSTATRWRHQGRIFGIEEQDRVWFPAFQFGSDGRPLPVIRQVLEHLGGEGWQTALWFLAGNGWLGGQRPVDLLVSNPGAVVEAAAQDSCPDAF